MKCPNCRKIIKNEDKACPYCGTWVGHDNGTPRSDSVEKRESKIKKLKENPWIELVIESNKPIFVLAVSWLVFFLAMMLLVYIFS